MPPTWEKGDLIERIQFIREHPDVMQETITIRFVDDKKLKAPLSLLPKAVPHVDILRMLFTNREKKYETEKTKSPENAKKIRDEMIQILEELQSLKRKESGMLAAKDLQSILEKLLKLQKEEIAYLETRKEK